MCLAVICQCGNPRRLHSSGRRIRIGGEGCLKKACVYSFPVEENLATDREKSRLRGTMDLRTIFFLLLVVAVVSAKKAHRRKHEKNHFDKDTTLKEEKDIFKMLEEDEIDDERTKKKQALSNELEDITTDKGGYVEDPCTNQKCGPGKECEIDEHGKAQCHCIRKCPEEVDDRRKVCSNHNDTWSSDCELYRMRCLCVEGKDDCPYSKYKHVHIDYYGSCKDITKCTEQELVDFPRRMRDWLFNVMQELARRNELRGPVLQLEQEAEKSHERKWVNAVIWKFCDLDVHPHDREVSRHELFPIRAPLMAMEHCVSPFLDSCDANGDHSITLLEWGNCLGLKEDEIQNKCESMHRGQTG